MPVPFREGLEEARKPFSGLCSNLPRLGKSAQGWVFRPAREGYYFLALSGGDVAPSRQTVNGQDEPQKGAESALFLPAPPFTAGLERLPRKVRGGSRSRPPCKVRGLWGSL